MLNRGGVPIAYYGWATDISGDDVRLYLYQESVEGA